MGQKPRHFLDLADVDAATLRSILDESGRLKQARRAANAHAVYVPEVRHPVEVGADQEAHLVQWLSKRLAVPVRAPALYCIFSAPSS